MDLRQNINKVHIDLTNTFSEVTISEKFNKNQTYFEILIKEGAKEVKMILDKKQIENRDFQWTYFSNPLNESSALVERSSSVDSIVENIKDIFLKNRFDEEYIKIVENQSFQKNDFINRKVTSLTSDREVTIQTGEISFTIGCGGGATAVIEGDQDIIGEVISDIIISEYVISIILQSGKKLDVEDDTAGEGLEIFKN